MHNSKQLQLPLRAKRALYERGGELVSTMSGPVTPTTVINLIHLMTVVRLHFAREQAYYRAPRPSTRSSTFINRSTLLFT